MGQITNEAVSIVKEFWYAPMYWPMMIGLETSSYIDKWYYFVLYLAVFIPLVLILTIALLPFQIIAFAVVLVAAIVVAAVNLTRGAVKCLTN